MVGGPVRAAGTPNLWRLAAGSRAGNMTTCAVSGVTCPADGWLRISAGQRASLVEATPARLPAPSVTGAAWQRGDRTGPQATGGAS